MTRPNQVRKHQTEMGALARDIVSGVADKTDFVLDCTPGGGKTGAATLFANILLDAGVIDRLLWLVPRISLAEQVECAFGTGFGCRDGRVLRVVDPRDDLLAPNLPNMPNVVGAVTTYQAVASRNNWRRFRDACLAAKTLFIGDEVQFLNDDPDHDDHAGWYRKVKHVKDACRIALPMSGTLWRTDGRRIPFIEYLRREGPEDRKLLYPQWDVQYTLRDAVADRAVLETDWIQRGGIVEYGYNGVPHEHDLLENDDDEESRKVRTFLSSERAVRGVIDDMIDHWKDWTERTYKTRMIVMADSIAEATRIRDYIQSHHHIPCTLATTKEERAGRRLRHFRERKEGQCLVTVAMAYVGFDCPDLSHLAYLSSTRAPSWMLQSFARVSRYDARAPIDYDRQHAFVFGPDDTRFREFMAWLRDQQDMGISDRRLRGPRDPSAEPVISLPDNFEPGDTTLGGRAVESLKGRIPPETERALAAFVRECPTAASMSLSDLHEVLTKAGVDLSKFNTPEPDHAAASL